LQVSNVSGSFFIQSNWKHGVNIMADTTKMTGSSDHYQEDMAAIDSARVNGHSKSGKKANNKQVADDGQSVQPQPLELTDGVKILHSKYEPRRWVIPDILPIGLTILVAKGKIGKSFILLEMCLNLVEPADGKIIYLDLEGDDLLLQERMRDILQGNELPSGRLYFAHRSEKLSGGLLDQIRQALLDNPGTIMVVIDVYGIVQASRKEADIYHSDSTTWTGLHKFAHDNKIALVVLHHTNKRQNVEDPFDLISGSNGIGGSCDAQWCLQRERNKVKSYLYVSGRAIIEDIKFEFEIGNFTEAYRSWRQRYDGPKPSLAMQRVLDVLNQSLEPLPPKRIAEMAGMKTARMMVRRMLDKGLLERTSYGLYCIPGRCSPGIAVDDLDENAKKSSVDMCYSVTLDAGSPSQARLDSVTDSKQQENSCYSVTSDKDMSGGPPEALLLSGGAPQARSDTRVTRVTDSKSTLLLSGGAPQARSDTRVTRVTHMQRKEQLQSLDLGAGTSEVNGHTANLPDELINFHRSMHRSGLTKVNVTHWHPARGKPYIPTQEYINLVDAGYLSGDSDLKQWATQEIEERSRY